MTRRLPTGWVLAALLVVAACRGPLPAGETRDVVVPRGASLHAVADSLAQAGIVASARAFRLYARISGEDRAVRPGVYRLAGDQPMRDVLDALVRGTGVRVTVTIPEGFTTDQIVARLAKALALPPDSLIAAVRDSAWRAEFDVPTPTLEGYLFPATYEFPLGADAREVVRVMLDRFALAWTPAIAARADSLAITRHEAVTMASIIEAETRLDAERPLVSAVYWNRIARGMPLQADPTVQYALPERVTRVLYEHLEVESPYNTYRNPGLPPGPIGAPGAASLAAAVAPADAPYLYFTAYPDGHHEFRRTHREHVRATAAARRLMRDAKAAAARRGNDR